MRLIAESRRRSRRKPSARRVARCNRPLMDFLEQRSLLAAPHNPAFDVIALYEMRADPNFAGIDGTGIGIADLDTGVYAQNPDLSGNVKGWYDAVNPSNTTPFDFEGHGSHTSGIEASTDPNIGVAYHANLYDVRVFAAPGESTSNTADPVAAGLQWVLDNHTKDNILVVNMSLGNGTNTNQPAPPTDGEASLIAKLEADGVTVVSSSGNSYGDYEAPGAAFPAVNSTLSVGSVWDDNGVDDGQSSPLSANAPLILGGPPATQFVTIETAAHADQISAFSQRSTLANQVFAPGEVIYSTYNGTGSSAHAYEQGTSMAAPMVSGVVALLQQAAQKFGGRYLSPGEIEHIVLTTADTIQDNTISTDLRAIPQFDANGQFTGISTPQVIPGTGRTFERINVEKAMQAVQQMFSTAGGGGGGGGPSGNLNGTIGTAVSEPALDGGEYFEDGGKIGTDGSSNVGPNDIDMFKVTTLSPGQIDLAISTDGNFTPIIRLFDSSGLEIQPSSSTVTNGVLVVDSPELADGTYYYGVSAADNHTYNPVDDSGATGGQSEGTYQLAIALLNPDPNGVIPGAVPYTGLPIVAAGVIGSDPPPINSTQRVQVGPGDVDMFQVIAPDTGTLVVATEAASIYGSQACDTFLRVFDQNGNELAFNDDNGSSTDSYLVVSVVAGETVYVAVSDALNSGYDPFNPYSRSDLGAGGLYDVTVQLDNGDQNGSITTAVPFNVGDTVQGVIGRDFGGPVIGATGSKDVDFIKLTPTASGILDLNASSVDPGMVPVLGIWTYDSAQGTAVKVAQTKGTSSRLDYSVTAGSTYYVSVTGLGNEDFLWYAEGSGSGGTTGAYTLTTQLLPSSEAVVLSDNSVTKNTPTPITVGAQVVGNIGMDGNFAIGSADVDIYRFTPTTSGTFAISTQTTMEGSVDTNLRLFDVQGNQLAVNDNVAPGSTGSRIVTAVNAGQTYYIGINASGPHDNDYNPLTGSGAATGNSTGPYILTIQVAQPGTLQFSAATYSQAEDRGSVTVTVNRVGGSDGTVQVNYTTTDGTAHANVNYQPKSGTLTFGPGVTSQSIVIGIIDDGLVLGNQTFGISLSSPNGGATLGSQAVAIVTILEIDRSPPGGTNPGGTYPAGTTPPVTLSGVDLEKAKKGATRIILSLSGPLQGTPAPTLADFHLTTVGKGKKHGKTIRIASAAYDPTTHSFQLTTRGRLRPNSKLKLTIDGLPGASATLIVGKGGARVLSATRAAIPASLSTEAVDMLFIIPPESVEGWWRHGRI
jgi:subtilisin family serine protease